MTMQASQTQPPTVRRLVRRTTVSPAGGVLKWLMLRVANWQLAIGWVVKWTPQIKWLYWQHTDGRARGLTENWQIHIGRFRIGAARATGTERRTA